MSRLIALYPRAWRDRYEAEFIVLMAERPPSAGDRVDIFRGALDARLHPQVTSAAPAGPRFGVRVGGALGILAGLLWVAASLAFYGAPLIRDLGYKDSGSAALIVFAAGLATGLSAMTFARNVAPGRTRMWKAGLVILLGSFGMALPWPLLVIGFYTTLLGILAFGIVAVGGRLGPVGLLLVPSTLLATSFNTEDERALFLVPIGMAMIVLGVVLGVGGVPEKASFERLRAALQPPSNSI